MYNIYCLPAAVTLTHYYCLRARRLVTRRVPGNKGCPGISVIVGNNTRQHPTLSSQSAAAGSGRTLSETAKPNGFWLNRQKVQNCRFRRVSKWSIAFSTVFPRKEIWVKGEIGP